MTRKAGKSTIVVSLTETLRLREEIAKAESKLAAAERELQRISFVSRAEAAESTARELIEAADTMFRAWYGDGDLTHDQVEVAFTNCASVIQKARAALAQWKGAVGPTQPERLAGIDAEIAALPEADRRRIERAAEVYEHATGRAPCREE